MKRRYDNEKKDAINAIENLYDVPRPSTPDPIPFCVRHYSTTNHQFTSPRPIPLMLSINHAQRTCMVYLTPPSFCAASRKRVEVRV